MQRIAPSPMLALLTIVILGRAALAQSAPPNGGGGSGANRTPIEGLDLATDTGNVTLAPGATGEIKFALRYHGNATLNVSLAARAFDASGGRGAGGGGATGGARPPRSGNGSAGTLSALLAPSALALLAQRNRR